MNNLSYKFLIGQTVYIKPISQIGRVTSVKFNGTFIEYNVEYWFEGNLRESYINEEDLQKQWKN